MRISINAVQLSASCLQTFHKQRNASAPPQRPPPSQNRGNVQGSERAMDDIQIASQGMIANLRRERDDWQNKFQNSQQIIVALQEQLSLELKRTSSFMEQENARSHRKKRRSSIADKLFGCLVRQ